MEDRKFARLWRRLKRGEAVAIRDASGALVGRVVRGKKSRLAFEFPPQVFLTPGPALRVAPGTAG